MKKLPVCKLCGKVGHYQYACYQRNKLLYQKRKAEGKIKKPKPLSQSKKKGYSERRKLIKELDKYTSLICRLGASDKNGYAACYSCGARLFWRQVDCGHYVSRRFTQTRWDLGNVRPQCLTKGHKVGDKDISEIKVGDKVSSLSGETQVIAVEKFTSPIIELQYDGGVIRCSPEHRLLAEKDSKITWLSAKQIYDDLSKNEKVDLIEL